LANNRVADNTDNPADIVEILKRLQASQDDEADFEDADAEEEEEAVDSDDAELEEDLAERLKNVDLNNADALWECLTEQERLEFEGMLQSGEIGKIVPVVKPWWECKTRKKLVEEVGAEATPGTTETEIPAVLTSIKTFDQLSPKPPADCVMHNLTNLLAAYAYTIRYFNGDHLNYPQEAVTCFVTCSSNLRANANFDSRAMAVEAVCHDCRNASYVADVETSKQLAADVASIFKGSQYNEATPLLKSNDFVLAALSDMHRSLSLVRLISREERKGNAAKEQQTFSKRFSDNERIVEASAELLERGKLKLYIKKVEYYLAFAKSFC
jgi:hypothetical protein